MLTCVPKRAPGYTNTRLCAQTGVRAPKCPPICLNGHLGTKISAHILKHMPGHQNAHPCAQTGAQAPKINFNNEILKRLKKKERRTKQYIEVA